MAFRVLIVDDSSVMRKIIMRNLRQAGVQTSEVFEAGDGYEALQIVEKQPVDLIFSDINMPNMDGIEFVRRARQIPQGQICKIIMITTEAGTDMVHKAVEAGADAYIVKPFTPKQLAEKVAMVVED